MNEIQLIQNLAISIIPLLFGITIHEASHAYVAYKLGDKTAYLQGRVSFNPLRHIDWLGTVFLPILLYFSTMGNFWFGYAKPVPIDARNFKNYRKDICLSVLAGPFSNLIMAFVWAIIIGIFYHINIQEEFFLKMAFMGVNINLSLFALNMLPILPFDGGKVLLVFIKYKYAEFLIKIERYGFFIIMLLSILGILSNFWMRPIMAFFMNIITFLLRQIGMPV